MPYPYVTSAKLTGDKIMFRIDVSDFKPEDDIEISGQATQSGGAFATISAITKVPATANGDKGEYYVDVPGDPIPPYRFRKDQDVTVFVRVSKVWVTVLGEHSSVAQPENTDGVADDSTTWDQPRKVSELSGDPWAEPQATSQ